MEPALIAAVVIPTIIGTAWAIYMIVHVTRECLRIRRDYNQRRAELNVISEAFSAEVRKLILEHRQQYQQQYHEELNFENNKKLLEDDNNGWMTEPFVNTTEENCSICVSDLKEDCIITKCFHKFHLECIKEWESVSQKTKLSFLCPLCKQDLYEELNLEIEGLL